MDEVVQDAGATALAMVPVEERALRGLELAEAMFTTDHRRQVAALLSVPADSDALLPYLALCVAEGFSPWANHVWLIPKKIKVKARDGGEDTEEVKHLPAVGRDGLLFKARQSPVFEDLAFGVVCERDTFEAWYEDGRWQVLHRQAHKPTEFEEGVAPDRWRGRVIGAWAMLFLKGRRPTYYFANLREHGRLRQVWAYNPDAKKRRPLFYAQGGGVTFAEMTRGEGGMVQNAPVQEWEGAWDYLSTMILKCAQSYVCRIGLGVTGFVPVDELRSVADWQAAEAGPGRDSDSVKVDGFDLSALDFGERGEEVRDRLQRAIDAANASEAFAWPPAKCEMVMTGLSPDGLFDLAREIERETALREQRAEREAAMIVDAVVVEPEHEPRPAGEADAAPVSPEEREERVAVLVRRRANLQATRMAATEEQQADVVAELDQIEAELRALGEQLDP